MRPLTRHAERQHDRLLRIGMYRRVDHCVASTARRISLVFAHRRPPLSAPLTLPRMLPLGPLPRPHPVPAPARLLDARLVPLDRRLGIAQRSVRVEERKRRGGRVEVCNAARWRQRRICKGSACGWRGIQGVGPLTVCVQVEPRDRWKSARQAFNETSAERAPLTHRYCTFPRLAPWRMVARGDAGRGRRAGTRGGNAGRRRSQGSSWKRDEKRGVLCSLEVDPAIGHRRAAHAGDDQHGHFTCSERTAFTTPESRPQRSASIP